MSSYLRQKLGGMGSSLFSTNKDEEKGVEALKNEEEEKDREIEHHKVGIMRSRVEREDPSAKEVDDLMIRRFLRARELDIEKASALFLKYLRWRREFVPNGSISPSEIPNDLAQNKVFLQGLDKMGRPVAVVFAGRHIHTSMEESKRFTTYTLDKICSRMGSGQEKFVCIGDLEGWGYANSDIRVYIASLSILQDCYPERLGKLYIVHAPYIFMSAWKAIYPFIDNKTKKKVTKAKPCYLHIPRSLGLMQISFVEDKKLRPTLLADIDQTQLPDIYGGRLPLLPIQNS